MQHFINGCKLRALVLSGGGVKGAFQLGVLRELLNNNPDLDYDVYTGISVGALNSSLLATGKFSDTLPNLEKIWFDKVKGNNSIWHHHLWRYILLSIFIILSFVSLAFLTFIFTAPKFITIIFLILALGSLYIPYYALQNTHSIYKNDPLRKLVEDSLDLDLLRSSGKKLRIGAVCFQTGKYKVVDENNDNIIKWIMASSAFPVFFPMEEIDGFHWTDGGITNAAPLQDALNLGVTEIDIVLASPLYSGKEEKLLGMPHHLMRIVDIAVSKTMRNDIELRCKYLNNLKIRIFMPEAQLTNNSLSFSQSDIKKIYEEGRLVAKKILS